MLLLSILYRLVRCLVYLIPVLARRDSSKDAKLPVLRPHRWGRATIRIRSRGMSGHRLRERRMRLTTYAPWRREGSRTPGKHERPAQRPGRSSVELLTTYSHTAQAADLHICVLTATRNQRPETKPAITAAWSLRERLSDEMIQAMACAYYAGATARDLAVAHDLSLSSVKRLLRIAGVRRTPPTPQSEKAMPATTHP